MPVLCAVRIVLGGVGVVVALRCVCCVQSAEGCVASAAGGNEVKCLVLMRDDFVRMLGDLEYLLDRSYDLRDGSDRLGELGKKAGKKDTLVHPKGEK